MYMSIKNSKNAQTPTNNAHLQRGRHRVRPFRIDRQTVGEVFAPNRGTKIFISTKTGTSKGTFFCHNINKGDSLKSYRRLCYFVLFQYRRLRLRLTI